MQIKLFTISIFDEGVGLEEMNRFMRGHRVLAVKQELVNRNDGSFWCFSIRYLLGAKPIARGEKKNKIGYREILDDMVLWHNDKSELKTAARRLDVFVKEVLKIRVKRMVLE